jgi:hypothetical protein
MPCTARQYVDDENLGQFQRVDDQKLRQKNSWPTKTFFNTRSLMFCSLESSPSFYQNLTMNLIGFIKYNALSLC